MANEFIWHLPTEAQQAMSYAANAAKADLAKQENMLRMAELGMRRQQAQQTAELNRLITQSQIGQQEISNRLKERELTQQGELARERNANYLAGLRIQFPEGRQTAEQLKQTYDEQLRKQQEAEIAKETNDAQQSLNALNQLEDELKKLGSIAVSKDVSNKTAKKSLNLPVIQQHLGEVTSKRNLLIEQLAQRGIVYDPVNRKFMGATNLTAGRIPTASQLQAPPPAPIADPRIDAIKREAAAAIQAGANPAAVYQRAAELGVELR